MRIEMPDPYPGRCLNVRRDKRCLDRDRHASACRFPADPPVLLDEFWQQSASGYDPYAKPWVPPWERDT